MLRKFIVAAFIGLSLFAALPARASDDSGYFLSWKQKKQLVWLGRIQDSQGNWYDVWICPGYRPPLQYSWKHLKKTGADFHEYVERNKYHSLKEGSKACFEWAFKECGLKFTVHGIPRAWGRHFSVAHERSQRRVFGWWMAYPWALFESTLETVFRGALGTIGTVGGTVSGIAVVPAYHALDSAVVGVWDLGANTVILPAVGVTWNTLIGPPLALVGQKPAESRVDGFWVVEIPAVKPPHTFTPDEVSGLGQWGLVLLKASKPFLDEREQNDAAFRQKEIDLSQQLKVLRDEQNKQRAASIASQRSEIQQTAAQPDVEKQFSGLAAAFVPTPECETQLREYLTGQKMSTEDINTAIRLLREYPSPRLLMTNSPATSDNIRQKTDPLRRSADILGDAVEDKVDEMIKP